MAFTTVLKNSFLSNHALYRGLFYKFYIDLLNSIKNISVLFEPRGLYTLESNLLEKDRISIYEINDINNIGQVYPESLPAFKIASYLGLEKMEGLYHNITLGPIVIKYP
jgi:hypothetical protein